MRNLFFAGILIVIAIAFSSCGMAQSAAQTAQRTLQSVGRTVF